MPLISMCSYASDFAEKTTEIHPPATSCMNTQYLAKRDCAVPGFLIECFGRPSTFQACTPALRWRNS